MNTNPDANITDDQAIALHLQLASYHVELGKLAKEDAVHLYHNDLAHRFAQEAILIRERRWRTRSTLETSNNVVL
jgi:hypothetical protein